MRDDELCKLLGLQIKDLHKLCGKLKEDRMLAVHTRPEQKEGQQRPVNRTYYYVDFRATIDAVKFRMHGIVKEVEKKMNKDASTKGYACPRCSKRFSILDAVDLERNEMELFLCDRCSAVLVEDDDSVESKTSQERLGRLMEQIAKIVDFLKKIDDVSVPPNDFDTAIANSVPVPKDKNQLAAAQFVPVNVAAKKSNAAAQPNLEISITNASEKSAAELVAEQQRRQQQAEKNALPVWHTQSTVDMGQGLMKEAQAVVKEEEVKVEEEKEVVGEGEPQPDAIEQYYALLAQQQAAEEAEEEEEEEDEEEEDDEFEEVVVTPSLRVEGEEGGEGEEEEGPPVKKVKAEEVVEEEDSEEEVDFEDV